MADNRQKLGRTGERIASAYLQKNGYIILSKNYRRKCGEIDIIARQGDYLVFIEVKTRTTISHGHPLEAVTVRKQKQISMVAQCYLAENNLFDTAARFDVVAVTALKNSRVQVELIPNAFELC
ncbi:MAG: YraN family protein [Deltaproteobacteria bacterium]|nr:YraN family protein [Deltaproteobacteria bacterium]